MNNKNLLLIGVGIIILIIVGFMITRNKSTGMEPVDYMQPTTNESSPSGKQANSLKVTLETQNDSGESGTAILTEIDGKVMVKLDVQGTPADVAQPAHIHAGSCPTPEEVIYTLTPVTNSTSETTLDTTLAQILQDLPLAINVHKSQAEVSVYVACGNIQAE